MGVLWDVFQCWRQKHDVPDRIAVLLKDLIAFRKRVVRMREYTNDVVSRNASGYMKRKWSHREKVDVRVLNEWECKVNECVQKRIASLQRKHINRRKTQILKNSRHLRSLEELQSKYVLVPADKAAQNVIVVCI